jgi:ankyrin repeat protein
MSTEPTGKLSDSERAFILAALNGDAATVNDLLKQGVPVDVRDSETYSLGMVWNITALMCAADKGHLEIVHALLDAGASVAATVDANKADGGGGSQPLHFAMAGGHVAVGEALLDAGADANAIGRSGRTPLAYAILGLHVEAVRMLLRRGADFKLKPARKDYTSPLNAAAAAVGQTAELVSSGGKLVLASALIWERKEEIFELFKLLLDAGADPNKLVGQSEIPLERLLMGADMPDDIRIPLVEWLLKAGADPNAWNKFCNAPLHTAVTNSIPRAVRLLCESGADVNLATQWGLPLKAAEKKVEMCEKDIATPFRADMPPERVAELRAREQNKHQRALEVLGILREFGASHDATHLAPKPAKPASRKTAAKKVLGAAHFLEFIYDGEAEWSLLAVKADIEPVTEAFTKLCKAEKCERDVEVKKAASGDELAPLIAVVKLKDNPWTVIYWSLFHVDEAALNGITESAKELSARLTTKSITFASQDTSGAIASGQFENGKDVESRDFDDDDEATNSYFAELGIYLPACYPKTKGKRSWLAAEKSSAAVIERADLIGL